MFDIELLHTLENHHRKTCEHSLRVARFAFQVASRLQLKIKLEVARAGLLHDIGKLFVPVEILSKPEKLSRDEYELVQNHVLKGYELLASFNYPSSISEGILQHHESENGKGYPYGISKISDVGRIVAVCDVFDAMTTQREYRESLPAHSVLSMMMEGKLDSLYKPYIACLFDVVQ